MKYNHIFTYISSNLYKISSHLGKQKYRRRHNPAYLHIYQCTHLLRYQLSVTTFPSIAEDLRKRHVEIEFSENSSCVLESSNKHFKVWHATPATSSFCGGHRQRLFVSFGLLLLMLFWPFLSVVVTFIHLRKKIRKIAQNF